MKVSVCVLLSVVRYLTSVQEKVHAKRNICVVFVEKLLLTAKNNHHSELMNPNAKTLLPEVI